MPSHGHSVPMRWVARLSVACAIVVGTAACDATSSPVTPPSAGSSFSATLSGSISAQLNGSAESLGDGSAPAAWVMTMTGSNSSGGISFSVEGMARPGPGTYTIASALAHGGNAPNSEFTAIVGLTSPVASFGSLSGTLTITDSSASAVSGRFSFSAQDPTDPNRNVFVEGSFTANNRDL